MTEQGLPQAAAGLISNIPLFSGLSPHEIEGLLRIFRTVTFADSAQLIRQGQPADGAYILASGRADALTALPGGGENLVAQLAPGSVIGEMALLERGVRSATVIARGPVSAYFIERDAFRILIAHRERAAFAIRSRITRTLCQRLRELNAKTIATDQSAVPCPLQAQSNSAPSLRRGQCSFDYRRFLPVLPAFMNFGPEEIDEFVARTEVIELDRGQVLFRQGDPGESAYVVVRGAIEIDHAAEGPRQRIGILGPGRLCGILALIEGHAHSLTAAAREKTAVLEIGKADFDAIFDADDRTASKFHDAIDRELLQSLARTVNHLTRRISQARIRGGRRETNKAKELQRAVASADYSPA